MESVKLFDILSYNKQKEDDPTTIKDHIKITFLRNFSVEGIEPFLKYCLYKSNIAARLTFGTFNNIQQEIFDDSSHLYSEKYDIVVVAICLESLLPDEAIWSFEDSLSEIKSYLRVLLNKVQSIIAITTVVPPFFSEIGITNIPDNKGMCYNSEKLNQGIKEFIFDNPTRCFLLDVDRFVRILGYKSAIDKRYWYSSAAPYKTELLYLIADEISKIARALKGASKKCLILDCDNTLWGGIIGEDGINGIVLNNTSSSGKIFYDFQKSILNLYARGITICLCSKNNEDDVWEVLKNHKHCLLKREHISSYRINWNDKASNILEISQELKLGLDSFVFVDDSSLECAIIKDTLSEVTVFKVPNQLFDLPSLLIKDGLFDSLYFTFEDKKRTQMYKEEMIRKNEKSKHTTLNDFLMSLDIKVEINEVSENSVSRIAQLTQKTNQFNFTTKRYSEKEISAIINTEGIKVFQIQACDKFGDLGIVGVMIIKIEQNIAMIDTFLMSCRALGRKIEYAFLNYCLARLINDFNIEYIQAYYYLSAKNQQLAKFWSDLGFNIVKEDIDGNRVYLSSVFEIEKVNVEFIKVLNNEKK